MISRVCQFSFDDYCRLFVEILKKLADVNEIQFLEDGSWSPIRANRECHVISSPAPARSSSRGTNSNAAF